MIVSQESYQKLSRIKDGLRLPPRLLIILVFYGATDTNAMASLLLCSFRDINPRKLECDQPGRSRCHFFAARREPGKYQSPLPQCSEFELIK
jgi:hypothetical protein